MNMVEILHTHVGKWRNDACSNYSRNGGKGVKENNGGDEFNYDILLRTFVNVTMYPQYNNKDVFREKENDIGQKRKKKQQRKNK
jgi:hypothetical protein